MGGKADSADSSFGSTPSGNPQADFKPWANQGPNIQFTKSLATAPFKHSMSHNYEVGRPMDGGPMDGRPMDGRQMDLYKEREHLRKQGSAVHGESLFSEKPTFVPQKGKQGEPVSQEQVFDMQHIRSTILKQEAEFREQV